MPIMKSVADASSQVAAIGYDPATQVFAVQFKKDGEPAPHIYHYKGVDGDTANAIENAESFGRAVRQLRAFDFDKLDASA